MRDHAAMRSPNIILVDLVHALLVLLTLTLTLLILIIILVQQPVSDGFVHHLKSTLSHREQHREIPLQGLAASTQLPRKMEGHKNKKKEEASREKRKEKRAGRTERKEERREGERERTEKRKRRERRKRERKERKKEEEFYFAVTK